MSMKILNLKQRIRKGGYTLIELIVAIGLFAIVITLVTGAYLMMIGIMRQAQATATGIDNLSFALEAMTRTIRTGVDYSCNGGQDCLGGGGTFSILDLSSGSTVTYTTSGGAITKNDLPITDSSVVNITSLLFYVSGTQPLSSFGDTNQPHVTIVISGTVSPGPGKPPLTFSVETGATMRGPDL